MPNEWQRGFNSALQVALEDAQETGEMLRRVRSTLCDAAQLIDGAVKDESWSEWDQSVRDAITARMVEIDKALSN